MIQQNSGVAPLPSPTTVDGTGGSGFIRINFGLGHGSVLCDKQVPHAPALEGSRIARWRGSSSHGMFRNRRSDPSSGCVGLLRM